MDDGNRVAAKDTFASWAIISESSSLKTFKRDVGIASVGDVFTGADWINCFTFAAVTGDKRVNVVCVRNGGLTAKLDVESIWYILVDIYLSWTV